MGGGEARKWKELEKELWKGKVKDNTVIEGYLQQPMVLWDLSEERTTKADQEGEEQEGDEEEGESRNHNCDGTVMVFFFK